MPKSQFRCSTGGSTDLFKPVYFRTSRSGGQKTLRCFPCCGALEHNARGYCGNSVVVEFMDQEDLSQYDLHVFSRFELASSSDNQKIDIGGRIEVKTIQDHLKTSEKPLHPWMEGRKLLFSNMTTAIFEINAKQESWHYGWVNRKAANRHVFKVYFFANLEPDQYICVDILTSTPFEVQSSKRKKKVPSAPAQAHLKKKVNNPTIKRPMPMIANSNASSNAKSALMGQSQKKKLSVEEMSPRNDKQIISNSQFIETAQNLALLKNYSMATIFSGISSKADAPYAKILSSVFHHLIRPEFFQKIQAFLKKNELAVTKQELLTSAYAELLSVVAQEIDLCLLSYNTKLVNLAKDIAVHSNIHNLDDKSLSFPFCTASGGDDNTSLQGFMGFVSQMRLSLMVYNGIYPFFKDQDKPYHMKSLYALPCDSLGNYVLPVNGKYRCNKSKSTYYTEEKPQLLQSNIVYEEIMELAFEIVNFKYDGSVLKVCSERSFLPDAFAEYVLDGQPNFNHISFMGTCNILCGRGGYIGWKDVKGSKIERKRITSSFIRDAKDRNLMQMHIKYEENVDNQSPLSSDQLRLLSTKQKIEYSAEWRHAADRVLHYELISNFDTIQLG